MHINYYLKYFAFGFLLLVVFYMMYRYFEEPVNRAQLYAQVFEVDSGFGYIIQNDGKILIRQENIPVIPEYRRFCTRNDARKVSEMVLKKLQKKQSPTISIEDLKKLEIATSCP